MASHANGDDNEPQEDDELTEQFDMDNKMNASKNVNGLQTINGKSTRLRPTDLRNRFKQAKTTMLTKRHYQIYAMLLLIILLMGILLIHISFKLLMIAFRDREPICQTSSCLQASARILSNANFTYDACDNFYQLTCDNWMRSNQLAEVQGHYSVREQVQDEIYDELRRYLDQVLPTASQTDPHFKAKQFYESCMDLGEVDLLSFNYFKHEIQNAGGWNLLGSWGGSWQHGTAIERLLVIFGVEPFLKIEVGADDLDTQLPYIIKIYPSGLGLPKNYYFDPHYKKVTEAYKQYMSEAVKIFGGTKLDSSQFAENTFNYEKRIAEVTPDKTEYQNPSNVFKRRFSIRELKLIAPSIKWSDILQGYFAKARLNDNTRVLLAFESYFRNVSNIISTTDMRGINDYLIWKMIDAYAPYLSKEFRIIHRNFQQSLYGMPVSNSLNDEYRWRFCIKTVAKFMGYAMSSIYVNNQISKISNVTVSSKSDIINPIRETILKNANLFSWSGSEDAQRLVNMKLKQMEIFVEDGNVARRKKPDYSWPVFPHEVRIHYDYASNKLYVPSGMLRIPFFNPNEPYSTQFGALGFMVSSHMLKAFDLAGLHYGLPDGRLSSNRTPVAQSQTFNTALRCLRSDLSMLPLKANDTLSQTYIDVGALKIAWLTYQELVARKGGKPTNMLPSLPFSSDQLFYISFGQTMCGNFRPATLEYGSETSNQLPNSMRVNTLLHHSDLFKNAFKCEQLSRNEKCHLWN
ncbi:hypothetical protein RDWZM_004967 [Blomia tropicalis]|uniref:Uncharacterized protein n=1 Tax=Blomia tropicalis TaxID=40697 RepID=A0A9Q0M8F3_BLOTA|nr:hypothetical protein RDWZM_004967 [Blomia tropicalis]